METNNKIKEIIKEFLKDNVGELELSNMDKSEIEFDVYPEVEEFITDNDYDYMLDSDEEMYSIVDEVIAELQ